MLPVYEMFARSTTWQTVHYDSRLHLDVLDQMGLTAQRDAVEFCLKKSPQDQIKGDYTKALGRCTEVLKYCCNGL